jgi:hypothetical protein
MQAAWVPWKSQKLNVPRFGKSWKLTKVEKWGVEEMEQMEQAKTYIQGECSNR